MLSDWSFWVAVLLCGLVFTGLVYTYIQMARKRAILDIPNERSSHKTIVIRGGGVIFPFAWLVFAVINAFPFPFPFPYMTLGLTAIAAVSFWDDIRGLSARFRFSVHLLAFTLMFHELGLFTTFSIPGLLVAYILCIGVLNAINFMDGINGITGLYGLSFFLPLTGFWTTGQEDQSVWSNPLPFLIAALLAFGFFNFRKKAKCFAGDVGSVSLAYLMVFFLLSLMLGNSFPASTESAVQENQLLEWKYILMLSMYGIDSIFTIIQRLWQRENIFKAHRKHLYQYLSNELGWPHLRVASLYALIQILINYRVLHNEVSLAQAIILLTVLASLYVVIKWWVIRKTLPNALN